MSEKEDFKKKLGARIREIRKNQNLTGLKLAIKSGISPAYLSEIERGLSNISSEKLSSIADVLGVSLQDLLAPSKESVITENTIPFPMALCEAADELQLKFSTTKRLFQGANSLIARRSTSTDKEWKKEDWINFYNKVKDYIEED